MINYLIKRILYGFLVIFGVAISVFLIFNALPGDPVALMAGQRTDVATRENIQKELGLDQPLSIQLTHYLNDISPVSIHWRNEENKEKYDYTEFFNIQRKVVVLKYPYLRRSYQTNRRVSEIVVDNIPGTFWLAFAAMIFATFFGIMFGAIAALNQNSWIDHSLVTGSVLGISSPSFVSAIIISMVFGFYLSDYTGLNMVGQLWETDPLTGDRHLELKNLILPAFTLGIRPLAIIVQLTRSSMLDVLSQDYIRTAKAKGLSYYKVITKHALKNALNPVITAVSGWFASLMAGAFFIEHIFNWKGLGSTTIKAVENLDFPVVMGSTLFIGAIFVVVNIFVDLLYALADPRVRLS